MAGFGGVEPDWGGPTRVTLAIHSAEPATVELLDSEMRLVRRMAVSPLTGVQNLNVQAGDYFVQARRLDGRTARVPLFLGENGDSLAVEGIWSAENARFAGRSTGEVVLDPLSTPPRALKLKMFRVSGDKKLRVIPANVYGNSETDADGNPVRLRLAFPGGQGLLLAQCTPALMDERKAVRTSAEDSFVLALPGLSGVLTIPDDRAEDGPPLAFRPDNVRVAALLDLLAAEANDTPTEALGMNNLVTLTQIDESEHGMNAIEQIAFNLVRDKFKGETPLLASAGAHYLLRINRLQQVRDWTRNIADYFPLHPDGSVIEGWRRLVSDGKAGNPPYPAWRRKRPPMSRPDWPDPRRPRPDNPRTDAALRFVEAAHRGPPALAMALERLRDGLNLFSRRLPNDPHFPDLGEQVVLAAERVRTWASVAMRFGALVGYRAPFTKLLPEDRTVKPLSKSFTLVQGGSND